MKLVLSICLSLALFISSLVHGQDIAGVATYKTQRKVDITLDSTQMDDTMKQQILAQLKKQFERTYLLDFNKNESIYKQEESLDAPMPGGGGGMQIVVAGSGDADILYKNVAEHRFANLNDMFGKMFLIKDTLTQRKWNLSKESKNIGNYTCFKATYDYEREVMRTMVSTNGEDVDAEESEPEMETITVTAWYTPQIPVSNGPGDYYGLPGLILEVSDGELAVLCSKIVLNPKDGVKIEEPSKGKEVSQAEYDAILEKKLAEMNEQFQGDGRRGDGNSVEIRIGG